MSSQYKLEPQRRMPDSQALWESGSGIESGRTSAADAHLYNDEVEVLSWKSIDVSVPDKATGGVKCLLQNVSGEVQAGELLAIMGPSGCGKTTLLNVLAQRPLGPAASVSGAVRLNGQRASRGAMRRASCYVEQQDHLLGALTARETLDFAARLALPSTISASDRRARIDHLLHALGLSAHAHTLVGTPLRRGLSGGQQRRLGVAAQLITGPRVLFLDEPTSGLDHVAAGEVVEHLRAVARANRIIVVASIHQPSTATFYRFDRLLLLAEGRVVYRGLVSSVGEYLAQRGCAIPAQTNPAEYLLELVNGEFGGLGVDGRARVDALVREAETTGLRTGGDEKEYATQEVEIGERKGAGWKIPLVLLHRNWVKSYRDVVAYGIRIAMYMGLAIMMGTVWLRLKTSQEYIQPFVNAIFFGAAFISFMAVAYVPAFLEDRAAYMKERANGLYGPGSFMLANFLIGIPYLFLISFLFSIITYWLCNFRPTGGGFFTYLMWLFLDLLAAESLVVLVASLFPIFVLALALTAFANGLWMAVGGFLVSPEVINVFWRYWARRIDYQAYVFEGMMVNEFAHRTYSCGNGCQCMYNTPLAGECKIDGQGVLAAYGYKEGHMGRDVAILLVIVLVYRVLGWVTLKMKKT